MLETLLRNLLGLSDEDFARIRVAIAAALTQQAVLPDQLAAIERSLDRIERSLGLYGEPGKDETCQKLLS